MPGDGVDNDCDGRIDEERKDGIDDDKDGFIDEDLQLVISGDSPQSRHLFPAIKIHS